MNLDSLRKAFLLDISHRGLGAPSGLLVGSPSLLFSAAPRPALFVFASIEAVLVLVLVFSGRLLSIPV